ncbi:hypothetical protein PMHK_34830 [Pseudomonas sp. MHK4]
MLILTRKPSETIRINDDISITVLSVSGQQVKLAFEAPKEVAVHRQEIYQRIQDAAKARSKSITSAPWRQGAAGCRPTSSEGLNRA